jgi:3'-phosphoadenosine 5'-phosphosulfate sulfotransferase (PAPS reductase)/FAD synthetase
VVNFETASRKGEPFKALINKYKGLPNIRNRSCTGKLKIEIANKFVIDCRVKKADRDNYLGIRKDEPNRYFKKKFDTSANYIMPLFDWGVRKPDVLEFWQQMPFNLVDTKYGSNCDYCFQKPIPRLVHCIREFGEESVQWWVDAEFETGKCFHQNKMYMKDLVELAKQPQFFNQEIEETETIGCFCGD